MSCSIITPIYTFPSRHLSRSGLTRHVLLLVLLLTTGIRTPSFALEPLPPDFEEISILFVVQGIGSTEVSGIVNNQVVYLSVTDVFEFLKVKHNLSMEIDSVSGFFIEENAGYLVDKVHNRIQYQGKVWELQPNDLMPTASHMYMKADLFGSIFGLDCSFNFRSLSVRMSTRLELPAIREMRQEKMRNNMNRLRGQIKADTIIGRDYPLFEVGMADWSVVATQRSRGGSDTRLNLSLGASIVGGEASVSLNYNNYSTQQLPYTNDSLHVIKPFDERQQYYRWRYVNNDHKGLRQIIAGKIFTQSTSSIYNPVIGVQFTNAPSTYRRSFGSYTLSNFTEPGWAVELYVNNELVAFTKADASGFFTFQVPLVYGNTLVKLRFYGPWGEERSREENVSIPFNFLPKGEFEYSVSAGMVEDGHQSQFGRATVNYGVTRYLTMGGGLEYLSSVSSGSKMPFINASLRARSNLLFSADYTHGVRTRGIMSYRLPSNLQFELYYTRYKKGQKAIIYDYLEERKIVISKPFIGRKYAVFSRFTLNQIVLPESKYTTAELLMSGALMGMGVNFTTYAIVTGQVSPYVYSNLSLSLRLPAQLLVTPQLQYEYNHNKVIAARCEVGKYLFRKGYMNVSYEQNFKSNFSNVAIGLRYDFSFSQVGFSAMRSNNGTTLVQTARGSMIYDGKSRTLNTSNRASVGTGGISILPFLDLNRNGSRDAGEPKVSGLLIEVNGGCMVHNKHDSTIRILNLEPYANYFIDMSRNHFENVAWQIKHKTISVTIEPNRVRQIEVPVLVMGEVSGMVYLKTNKEQTALGRISVCFYKNDTLRMASVLSETDGFFSFTGLAPGNYTARIDPAQLHKLGMVSLPLSIPFHISDNREGDVVESLEFLLQRLPKEEEIDNQK